MLNDKIFFFFYNLAHHSAFWDWFFSFTAQDFPRIVIALAIFFLLFHHEILSIKRDTQNEKTKEAILKLKQKWKEIFFVSLSVFIAWISAILLKLVFQVPRPFLALKDVMPLFQPTDYSFPSGHSALFMAIAVAIFMYHKENGYVFFVFALMIGFARIIAGVHYPLDILGGYLIGGFISYLLIKLFSK